MSDLLLLIPILPDICPYLRDIVLKAKSRGEQGPSRGA